MPFSIRPYRRFPVHCAATYKAGPFLKLLTYFLGFGSVGTAAKRSAMRGTRSILLVIGLGMMIYLSGCMHLINSTVELPEGYSPPQQEGPLVLVPSFIDQRLIRHRIGLKRFEHHEDTADVLAGGDLNNWLAVRLGKSLATHGLHATENSELAPYITIQGETLKLFIEPVMRRLDTDLEADLFVRIRVSRLDGLVAERKYYVKATEKAGHAGWLWASDYEAALEQATQLLMSRVSADVLTLLNRYPDPDLHKKGN
jgi:hypothetical protein